jgi:WD40 repeat protein
MSAASPTLRDLWLLPHARAAAVDWSREGDVLALGDAGGSVSVRDGERGRELGACRRVHPGGVSQLRFSPAAPVFATTGRDGTLRLWSLRDCEPVAGFDAGACVTGALAWSDDGRLLAVAARTRVVVFDERGDVQSVTQDHGGRIEVLRWLPDAQHLLVSTCDGVHLYDAVSGRRLVRIRRGPVVRAMEISPDGAWVACACADRNLLLWRMSDGRELLRPGYADVPSGLAWSPDGALLATTKSSTCTLWRLDRPGGPAAHPRSLDGHPGSLSAVAFGGRGSWLASGCRGGHLRLWKPAQGSSPVGARRTNSGIGRLAWARHHSRLAVASAAGVSVYGVD